MIVTNAAETFLHQMECPTRKHLWPGPTENMQDDSMTTYGKIVLAESSQKDFQLQLNQVQGILFLLIWGHLICT